MNINALLQGVQCDCGKMHHCNIESVYIESGAIKQLEKLCENYKSVLVVADENTFYAAGEKVLSVLCEKEIKKVIFGGKTVLIPDERAIEAVENKLCGCELIIAVGSGVIQDLCKYVSFFNSVPYMVVATAPSMDGYASDGAAMILKGMKETVKAGLPKAIIADTSVLKNAPIDMIKAGYGDIVGKYSALCDWKLATAVNGEYFCQYIYDVTYSMVENTLLLADGLLKRNEESVKALMEALVIVGIMMSFATSSRPASGSEHHLSHFFEIVGIVEDEPYFSHGIDVAYSTVITAKIREEILKKEFPCVQYCPERATYVNKMHEVYKDVADGCIALQDKIGTYSADRASIYKEKEKEIREILSEMPPAQKIENMLSLVELDMKEFYSFYGEEKVNKAILYAKDLKDRYTVLWMLYDMFGGEYEF